MMKLISRLAPAIAGLFLATTAVVSTAAHAMEHDLNKLQKLLDSNAQLGYAVYSDTLRTAQSLRQAVADLRTDPSEENLMAAKKAWLVAREPYGQTEALRFRLSPIESSNYKDEDGLEGDINAWPLGEALIDYVVVGNDFGNDQLGVTEHQTPVNDGKAITVDNLQANIINSPEIEINQALIGKTATAEDEHDVLAGYHAIEFMLWGQDLNNNQSADTQGQRQLAVKTWQSVNASGGLRPLSDFISKQKNDEADRRLTFLEVVTDKLVADLQTVVTGWQPGVAGNYRDQFTNVGTIDEAKQKLAEILTGMGTLAEGELAGERMQIALSADSQEDEQSCFSDNTHRDIWLNVKAIVNVYYGDYLGYDSDLDGKADSGHTVKGYGVDDYLAEIGHAELGKDVEAKLALIQAGADKIDSMARQGTPVDVMIMDPSSDAAKPMRETIIALNKQSASIAKLAKAMGLTH